MRQPGTVAAAFLKLFFHHRQALTLNWILSSRVVVWDVEEKLAVKTFVNTDQENWRHLKVGGTQGAGPSLSSMLVLFFICWLLGRPGVCGGFWCRRRRCCYCCRRCGFPLSLSHQVFLHPLFRSISMFLYRKVFFMSVVFVRVDRPPLHIFCVPALYPVYPLCSPTATSSRFASLPPPLNPSSQEDYCLCRIGFPFRHRPCFFPL